MRHRRLALFITFITCLQNVACTILLIIIIYVNYKHQIKYTYLLYVIY